MRKKYLVRRICAWCGKRLEDTLWKTKPIVDCTHTMCDDCSRREREKLLKNQENNLTNSS